MHEVEIAEHLRAEAELRRLNRALRMLSDSNQALIRITDEATLLNEICRVAVEVGGYRTAWVGFAEEDEANTIRPVAQAGVEQGYRSSLALPLCAEGRTFGALTIYAGEADAFDTAELGILTELAGDLAFGLVVLRTRQERERAEATLRQSQQAYAALVDSIEGIVWEADAETFLFSFVSRQAERLLGYAIERWLEEPSFWRDHVHPEDRGWAVEFCLDRARRGVDHAFNYRMIAADGRVVWLHDLVTVVFADGRPCRLRGIMVDITDSRRAEEALRDSEERFRQVTENIDEVFWLTDVAKSQLIYVSPAYSRVWGRSCESLRADPSSWLQAIHPEERERVREAALTLQTVGAYDLEYRIERPDGTVRWVHDRAFPIKDHEGQSYRIAGVAQDITAKRQLEEQLRQSQKMEAIGRLAGGIAHDFNNLLAVIQMQCSLLLDVPAGEHDTAEGIRQIMAASERAANLTRQLLTFSRQGVRKAQDIDLGEVTGAMTQLLRRILGEDISFETRFAPALPLVNADRGMMEQVFMNLAVNARDAMPAGGSLTVTLDGIEAGREQLAAHPQVEPGRFVCLGVSDTGCGIPAENLARIFEPFFTTKETGQGTGLGLAMVFGIVEQHHGWIEVASELGRGTTFRVSLPAVRAASGPAAAAAAEQAVRGGTEAILLVEDEAAVRSLARVALERYGYRVIEADSAAAALRAWEVCAGAVDLLLTDLVMPGGVSGGALAELLLGRRPDLKVVYTSGYSDDLVRNQLGLRAGQSFLQKPYPIAELAATVRRCLDAS